MKNQNHFLTFLLLITLNLSAQKYELGNVTIAELNEKIHPKDSAAVAAFLFKKGDVHFEYSGDDGFEMHTKVSCKIKIYKKEGYDYANFVRNYYVGGKSKEHINFSKAYTYNLVNGKIEKTKLKSDSEFDEKFDKSWNRKKISMPNVKEGAIIEFEYLLKSPIIGVIDEWEFQEAIPVNYSEFVTIIPEYLVYNPILKGFILPKIVKNSKNRTITYTYVRNIEPGATTTNTLTNRVNGSFNLDENIATYTISDVPALKEESFVNNIKNYSSSISHELSMTKYPNEAIKTFSTDWESVTKTIYNYDDFGAELNKTGYFEDDLKTLLTGLTTREEKVATIFNFVKSKVKWNESYGYSCEEGVRSAYKKGSGNAAEINLMLTAMLRYAGVDANPVLVSTRSNGIALFPNRTAYNYVISAVEIENDLILLDATSKYAFPNILPIRDLNWVGRMIRKDGTSASVDLMPKMISKDVVSLIATINKDGTIEGKLKEHYSDYNAFLYRLQYADLSNETNMERLEKKYKGLEVEAYEMTNKTDLNQPIIESYGFKNNNNIEIIGDKMYFSPLLFFAMTENFFKQDNREYPIDFAYPNQARFIMNITIPDGYVVETLPQSVSIPMSDNGAALKYMVANTDSKIQLSMTLDINSPIFLAENYNELKAFFAEVVKKQTEKIVLKKI